MVLTGANLNITVTVTAVTIQCTVTSNNITTILL